jgi:hypothetical protein
MCAFREYQHIERLDSSKVKGLLLGKVYVFPKIDGSNWSVWSEEGVLRFADRHHEVSPGEGDPWGLFFERDYIQVERAKLEAFFAVYPNWRLYGEWLVPHSLNVYRPEAWRKFYVFDVRDANDEYISYERYSIVFDKFGLDYIPLMATVENATFEILLRFLEKNTYLIPDGGGFGEGIVIKRYGFENKYGHVVWAKLVRNEFKELNTKTFGALEIKGKVSDELAFVQLFVTRGRIMKEIAKKNPWDKKYISELLNRVYHDLVNEELWDFVKERKNKVNIDFKVLQQYVVLQIKEVYSELFAREDED